MPFVLDPRDTQTYVKPATAADEEFNYYAYMMLPTEQRFATCVGLYTKEAPDLGTEWARDQCRKDLKLGWYYQTPYEPTMRWVNRNDEEIAVAAVGVVLLSLLWRYRRAIGRTIARIARALGRGVFALTGYHWADVVRRWRGFDQQP